MSTEIMNAHDAIRSRRSVRRFDPSRTVSDEALHTILDCAMSAPTAVNSREWSFVVARSPETRTALADAHPYCKFAKLDGAVCIVLCATPSMERAPGHWQHDCGACAENALVAAAALGIGATWASIHPHEDRVAGFRRVLQLPEDVVPFCILTFGYPPAGEPLAVRPSRYDAAKVHTEKW